MVMGRPRGAGDGISAAVCRVTGRREMAPRARSDRVGREVQAEAKPLLPRSRPLSRLARRSPAWRRRRVGVHDFAALVDAGNGKRRLRSSRKLWCRRRLSSSDARAGGVRRDAGQQFRPTQGLVMQSSTPALTAAPISPCNCGGKQDEIGIGRRARCARCGRGPGRRAGHDPIADDQARSVGACNLSMPRRHRDTGWAGSHDRRERAIPMPARTANHRRRGHPSWAELQ